MADDREDGILSEFRIEAASLGSREFLADYDVRFAYVAGAMYKGIASKELVIAMGKARLMSFFGTGGLCLADIENGIRSIQAALGPAVSFGANLLSDIERPETEERTVDLYLRHGVHFIEAAGYMKLSLSLIRYRLRGLQRKVDGTIVCTNRVLAKVSRPEVALAFLQPAPAAQIKRLLDAGQITAEEADLGRSVPVADDICVECDSGGHTDQGVAYALLPAMIALRDEVLTQHRFNRVVRVGAAGGIGTPSAAAAAFIMGADFILTGSINQCTVEAGTSEAVKEMLASADVQDTAYAPSGDLFELGAKVQVLRKGLFFPARANKLYELFSRFNSLDEIDLKTRKTLEEKYFKRSFDAVWAEVKKYYIDSGRANIDDLGGNPKKKMAMIFRWYLAHTTKLALSGDVAEKVDFQIQCGPAIGSFNRWVKGTPLESWRNRHVAAIGEQIMLGTANLLSHRLNSFIAPGP
ncbi:PfaD family polyunsaturated fatty acid/polyketide biosynthesis protein [Bradyrhizobium sp. Leaf401]|uniref:PfaD family polyunsaturated fatty acid/polyketide biosynthesis protein n=1 Tax=Bradyrhizobium sp. Leaf401 TaxID=2876564 RepID=UPI001E2F4DFA|nr:PfaD family polyunsaturated fatty acid/polyketide biosynthesis protein [Bradyrhizobium sp. Leaf401]